MTNTEFAIYAMRLAKRAATWGSECLELPEYRDKPIRQEAADRFIISQREMLDYIERETRA